MGKAEYYHNKRRNIFFIGIFAVLTVIMFFYSLSVGYYDISFGDCYRVFIDHITGNIVDFEADDIIWGTRVPISLFAVIAGVALSIGGAVMQTAVRNPLADPYTMGIASGASLGATLSLVAGITLWEGFKSGQSLVAMAFVFSLIPVATITLFSSNPKTTPSKMILIGIAVMYVFSAANTLLMLTATTETHGVIFQWNMGSLANVDWNSIPIPLIVSTVCITILMLKSRTLNVMMSGPTCSRTLGVDSKKATVAYMILISLMTASVVCFCGTIGFVGLVGPHVARIFVGSESKYLIPASAAVGGFFLLLANTIAMVAGDVGMPVGVISALIGCPLFIVILVKMRRRVWA